MEFKRLLEEKNRLEILKSRDELTQEGLEILYELTQALQLQQTGVMARCNKLENALLKIIEMNRQTAIDQYGDADKAESWSCIVVARKALNNEP